MEYRKATRDDLEEVLSNRIEFVTSIKHIDNINQFRVDNRDYFEKHIDSDDLIIFAAFDNDKIVSICMACIYEVLPVPSSLKGKMACILNVYTKKDYRRQGHAEKLMKKLINELKSIGVGKITLLHTDDGLKLYQKLGFTKEEEAMALRI